MRQLFIKQGSVEFEWRKVFRTSELTLIVSQFIQPPKAAVKKQKKIERYATSFAQLQSESLAQRATLVSQRLNESQNLSFDSIPNTENSNDSVLAASNHPGTPPPYSPQMLGDPDASMAASASTLTSGSSVTCHCVS